MCLFPHLLGGISRRIAILGLFGTKRKTLSEKNNLKAKRARGVSQVVKCIPSKYETLSSNPSAAQKSTPEIQYKTCNNHHPFKNQCFLTQGTSWDFSAFRLTGFKCSQIAHFQVLRCLPSSITCRQVLPFVPAQPEPAGHRDVHFFKVATEKMIPKFCDAA
jgi:hypothetical protein